MDKEIREQAWKYFELHANQRMTLFNFYIQDAEIVYDQHENERLVKLTPPSEIPPKLLKVLPDEDDVDNERLKIRLSDNKYGYLIYPRNLNAKDVKILRKQIDVLEEYAQDT